MNFIMVMRFLTLQSLNQTFLFRMCRINLYFLGSYVTQLWESDFLFPQCRVKYSSSVACMNNNDFYDTARPPFADFLGGYICWYFCPRRSSFSILLHRAFARHWTCSRTQKRRLTDTSRCTQFFLFSTVYSAHAVRTSTWQNHKWQQHKHSKSSENIYNAIFNMQKNKLDSSNYIYCLAIITKKTFQLKDQSYYVHTFRRRSQSIIHHSLHLHYSASLLQ